MSKIAQSLHWSERRTLNPMLNSELTYFRKQSLWISGIFPKTKLWDMDTLCNYLSFLSCRNKSRWKLSSISDDTYPRDRLRIIFHSIYHISRVKNGIDREKTFDTLLPFSGKLTSTSYSDTSSKCENYPWGQRWWCTSLHFDSPMIRLMTLTASHHTIYDPRKWSRMYVEIQIWISGRPSKSPFWGGIP